MYKQATRTMLDKIIIIEKLASYLIDDTVRALSDHTAHLQQVHRGKYARAHIRHHDVRCLMGKVSR